MERIDDTGLGGMRVIQKEGIGYGVDAILLAAFAAGETGAKGLREGSSILDLGSGSGIIGFALLHKVKGSSVVGVDVREGAVDRAGRAAELNGVMDRIHFICADCKGLEKIEGIDAVVSNPPYFRKEGAIPSATGDKYLARHETSATLTDFVETSVRMLDNGGSLYMVHRPDRLVDIFTELRAHGMEPKELQLVTPHPGEAANIALIHAVRGAGSELKLLPDIAVHKANGEYTDMIERIYERK